MVSFGTVAGRIGHELRPASIVGAGVDNRRLTGDTMRSILVCVIICLVSVFLSVLTILLYKYSLASTVSNIVTSVNDINPNLNRLKYVSDCTSRPTLTGFVFTFSVFLNHIRVCPILITVSLVFEEGEW